MNLWATLGEFGGACGDWATDEKFVFTPHYTRALTAEELEDRRKKIEKATREADEERERNRAKAKIEAQALWNTYKPAGLDNAYIKRKQLKGTYGTREDLIGRLVIPLYNEAGELVNLQYIDGEGEKRPIPGGQYDYIHSIVGEGEPAYMAEGFATSASIYEATGKAVVMAVNAGNLPKIARQFPKVTIVADNDKERTGEQKAQESGLPYILIPEVG